VPGARSRHCDDIEKRGVTVWIGVYVILVSLVAGAHGWGRMEHCMYVSIIRTIIHRGCGSVRHGVNMGARLYRRASRSARGGVECAYSFQRVKEMEGVSAVAARANRDSESRTINVRVIHAHTKPRLRNDAPLLKDDPTIHGDRCYCHCHKPAILAQSS